MRKIEIALKRLDKFSYELVSFDEQEDFWYDKVSPDIGWCGHFLFYQDGKWIGAKWTEETNGEFIDGWIGKHNELDKIFHKVFEDVLFIPIEVINQLNKIKGINIK